MTSKYRKRRTFNKSFSKGKTRHCKSIAKNRRTETGVVVD